VPLDTSKLLSADRTHIISALTAVSNKAPADWLSLGHPGPDGQLPSTWTQAEGWTPAQRVEAVAFSGPTHCVDGWGYVSRALSAFLAGDFHAARHLAYYAQLRAGLSILAGVGVGVFNGINFAVLSNGGTERVDPTAGPSRSGLGTHIMVWEALEAWSASTPGADLFLSLMKVRNSTIEECVDAIWPGFNSQSVATQLVSAWGLDLKRGKTEHRYRKVSSYVPHAFNALDCQPVDVAKFLSNIWQLFEPSAGPGFDQLDRYLLRAALWRQHEMSAPGDPIAHGALKSRYLLLPDDVRAIASEDFLLGLGDPEEPFMVQLARSNTAPAASHEMIARSLLLLRAALAITHSNLSAAGVTGGQALRPWLDQLAIQRGFFATAASIGDMADLWSDVELALEDMGAGVNPIPACLHDWFSKSPVGIPTVTEAERIGLWSLCA
jgi:hypothetical protein